MLLDLNRCCDPQDMCGHIKYFKGIQERFNIYG